MAPDERDRNFDKAIARHLRSAASSGAAANTAANSSSRRDACPDAETLAAYHERSLLPEELNSWKEHIVGCAHCQELLAHLEATEDIPLHATEEEGVFARMGTPAVTTTREMAPRPMAATPSRDQREASATRRDDARASRLSHGVRWRWLAPAGAIAAGLLVWIALHENQPPRFPNLDEVKMAKNQEPAAPPPPAVARVPAALPREQSKLPESRSVADELSSSNARAEADAFKLRQKPDLAGKAVPAQPSNDKEGRERKDLGRDSSAYLGEREKQADLDAKTVGGAVQPKSEKQAPGRTQVQAQAGNVQSQNQNNAYSPKVSGPGPLGQAEPTKKMKAAPSPPPAPAPAADATSALTSIGAVSETVMVSDSRLIAAPGSNFVWRTGRAGLIDFSQDAGRSWVRQTSGVLVDLQTGSAPSDQVCWIVGRVGAILLTTDGGAHWKLIPSPLKEDLGSVQATDALHATIWNVRNTKSFTTSDGGLTWQRVAKQ